MSVCPLSSFTSQLFLLFPFTETLLRPRVTLLVACFLPVELLCAAPFPEAVCLIELSPLPFFVVESIDGAGRFLFDEDPSSST